MIYNFDELVDRKNKDAVKYSDAKAFFGTEDLIPLWVADMDFKVAEPVIQAAKDRADHGVFGYVSRVPQYWDAIINWQKRRNNWDIPPDELSFSPGVVPSLIVLIKALSNEGDKVLIQPPVYHQFKNAIQTAGREMITNPLKELDGQYFIDFEDF